MLNLRAAWLMNAVLLAASCIIPVYSSSAGAAAIALPAAPQSRYSGFLQPQQDVTHAYLVYGFKEPPSAAGAGVSPFVVSLDNPLGNAVNSFLFEPTDRFCLEVDCAYTILGVVGEGTTSASVLTALGRDSAQITIDGSQSFLDVFGSIESDLLNALISGDTGYLERFFLDNVGRISGAGVSPFLPDLARLAPGAAPTPHPDCPPLSLGAAPTPYPDCPGASTLVSFGNASFAGTANAEVSQIPEPSPILLIGAGILGLWRRFKST